MRLVLILVVFVAATGLVALVIGLIASRIANRFPKMRADMEDEGCSCTFGLIALASMGLAGALTAWTSAWLFRNEGRLAADYAPMAARVAPLYLRLAFVPADPNRATLKSPALVRHGGSPVAGASGILVLQASAGSVTADGFRMAQVDEPCRASPGGMPRYVIGTSEHSIVIGHRVGAGAGPIYSRWSDVYLVDLVENDVLYARGPEDPDDEFDAFLERAKAEGGACR